MISAARSLLVVDHLVVKLPAEGRFVLVRPIGGLSSCWVVGGGITKRRPHELVGKRIVGIGSKRSI